MKVHRKAFDNPALEILWFVKQLTTLPYTNCQRRVLLAFHTKCVRDSDFVYYGFEPIAQHTGLEWKRVRVLTRILARKGLLEYQAGLFTCDGEVAGAGYTITAKGRAVAQIIEGPNHE
jgi:hypothetical protein